MTGILLVDAANVIGSVPDGWWRDRAAAATRLHRALSERPGAHTRIVLVLEGKARAGVPAGTDGAVTTVHAAGSGDDEIVAQAYALSGDSPERLNVATADRGLIARLPPGAVVVGPRSVRDGC